MRLLNQLAQSRPDVDLSCVAVFLILVVQDFPLISVKGCFFSCF